MATANRKRCTGPLFASLNKLVDDNGVLFTESAEQIIFERRPRTRDDPTPDKDPTEEWFKWENMQIITEHHELERMGQIEGIYKINPSESYVNRLALYAYYHGDCPKPTFRDLAERNIRPAFKNTDENPLYQPSNVEWVVVEQPQPNRNNWVFKKGREDPPGSDDNTESGVAEATDAFKRVIITESNTTSTVNEEKNEGE